MKIDTFISPAVKQKAHSSMVVDKVRVTLEDNMLVLQDRGSGYGSIYIYGGADHFINALQELLKKHKEAEDRINQDPC